MATPHVQTNNLTVKLMMHKQIIDSQVDDTPNRQNEFHTKYSSYTVCRIYLKMPIFNVLTVIGLLIHKSK